MRRHAHWISAFACAWRGLVWMVRREPHARLHLVATALVLGLAFWFRCSPVEWALLLLAIAAVWAAEALNTAIERLCDRVQPEPEIRIREIKDVAAGGVLAASLAALGVGVAIFGPKLLAFLWP